MPDRVLKVIYKSILYLASNVFWENKELLKPVIQHCRKSTFPAPYTLMWAGARSWTSMSFARCFSVPRSIDKSDKDDIFIATCARGGERGTEGTREDEEEEEERREGAEMWAVGNTRWGKGRIFFGKPPTRNALFLELSTHVFPALNTPPLN